MEEKKESLRKHRIPAEKRKECLKLFEEGWTEHIYGTGLQEALCLRGQLLGGEGKQRSCHPLRMQIEARISFIWCLALLVNITNGLRLSLSGCSLLWF